MATKYGGMPSGIQANLEKKKKTPIVSNSTTLNTPQAVQNAMAAKATAPTPAPKTTSVPASAPIIAPTLAPTPALPYAVPAGVQNSAADVKKVNYAADKKSAQYVAAPAVPVKYPNGIPSVGTGGMPSGVQNIVAASAATDKARINSGLSAILDGGRLQDKAYNDVVAINTVKPSNNLIPSVGTGGMPSDVQHRGWLDLNSNVCGNERRTIL